MRYSRESHTLTQRITSLLSHSLHNSYSFYMYVPFLGRLSIWEYPILVISFTLAWLEYIISVITWLLPVPVISFCTWIMDGIYTTLNLKVITSNNYLQTAPVNTSDYTMMINLIQCENIHQQCELFGYGVENHVVRTNDDYLLTLHRITKPHQGPRNGKVIYLHHGLLMSSEIWVTMVQKDLNLPFLLYDLGYDVWLGNNRGNKYCQKHLSYNTNSEKFWNFSMDEFVMFDIPNIIDYILDFTKVDKLTYLGFSQGTAQAFASVSMNNHLNSKIDQIIAISPATTPHGLYSKFLDLFLKASPNVVFLLFSRKMLMPSVFFWQKIMYPPLFNTFIDIPNYLLFNWRATNIVKLQKLASYAHLYSPTSVKVVVHWFQIMKNKNFQMYFDPSNFSSYYFPVSFPLKNIKVPIHLIYGGADSLVDIEVMKRQLPDHLTTTSEVKSHEHLDNIWGQDIETKVFPHVFRSLGIIEPPKLVDYQTSNNPLYTKKPNPIVDEPIVDEPVINGN